MKFLAPLLANFVLLASALGFGTLLDPLFDSYCLDIDMAALTLLGGLGILGTLLFVVGQFVFTRFVIDMALLAGIALGLRKAYKSRHAFTIPGNLEFPPLFPVLIVAFVLLLTVLGGMALPVGNMNNDAIAYHYLGPRTWLHAGIIRAVPHEVLTYFPVLIESHYAALMSLGGQRAPQFFSVISLISLLLVTASLAARLGLRRPGIWWSLAVVSTMPAAYMGAIDGYIDALFACFALITIRIVMDARRSRDFVLLGMFSGFCMATKYTGILTFAVLLACLLLIYGSQRPAPGVVLRNAGILLGAAALCACPIYLRNWILYGCPIYPPPPGLLIFFTPKELPPKVLAEVLKNVQGTGAGLGRSLWSFLCLPFNLTYHTSNFRGAGGIGLVPLALAPVGLWKCRKSPAFIGLAIFALLSTCAWFVTAQVSRYLIPIYVIAAVLGVVGWRHIHYGSPRVPNLLAKLTVGVSLAYGLLIVAQGRAGDVHSAFSSSYEEVRQRRETARFDSFQYINREPQVQNVFVINCGIATYFIEKEYTKPCGRWGERLLPAGSPAELLRQAREVHATHILDVEDDAPFVLPGDLSGLTLVFEREDQRIYKIN